jgi:DNA-binding transcriptional ArsR family regulator
MASERDGLRQRAKRAKNRRGLDRKTITGMADPVRAEIHVILTERAASVSGLSRDLGLDYEEVRHDFKRLKEVGLIEPVGERRVRGTTEVFYRAVKRACIDDVEWPAVPEGLKGGLRGSLLDSIANDAIDAIEAEIYDSLEGAHMSRTPGLVDDRGWDELREWLRRTLEGVIEIFDNNRDRLAAANAIGTAVTVSILGYPSTTPGRPAGPPPDAGRQAAREQDEAEMSQGSKAKMKPKSKRKTKREREKRP